MLESADQFVREAEKLKLNSAMLSEEVNSKFWRLDVPDFSIFLADKIVGLLDTPPGQ